jgi:hypothetical protein
MVGIKVERDKKTWDIDLYSDESFIKTICTCYEEDYAHMIAGAIADRVGAKVI